MIIGTAGHIDHGKTTLVRALTGIDTDRLPQEKARGISIELGFAYTSLPAGVDLGYIDVPGHERFVHTMLAGACGIDFALLVVAADDGVMPQTVEHTAIIDLLGIRRGAVAITKADRVGGERVLSVIGAVNDLLAGTGLSQSPVFVVDARVPTDPQIAALRAELERAASAVGLRNRTGLFRLCIDRAFTLAGHGTVVTGTAESGEIGVGDSVSLLPAGQVLRVRSLHAQNRSVPRGGAGDRLALNLAGIDAAALRRGDWLADPRGMAVTDRVDARLSLLAGMPVLEPYAPVHVHYGATHTMAHVLGLETERLHTGPPAWVQLVFDAPVAIAAGARFIVRNAQATRTVGGGRFLDAAPPVRRRRSEARRQLVHALDAALGSGDLTTLLAAAPCGFSRAALMRATARPVPEALPPGISAIAAGSTDDDAFVIADQCWQALRARTVAVLRSFHVANPAEPGPDVRLLRGRVEAQLPRPLWRALVDSLVEEKLIARAGPWLQLPEHAAALSVRDEPQAAVLLERLYAGTYDPPWARDLARDTGLTDDRVRGLLAGLGRAGRAHPIVPDLYYDARRVAELAAVVADLAASAGCVDAAAFRDRIGIGRKRSIQILEFFDRVGYTRRQSLGRVLRTAARWGAAR